MNLYFENIHTRNRFKVQSFNKEQGTVTLVGRHGVPFTQQFDKALFDQLGYRPVQEAAPEAPPAPPVPQPPAA